MKKDILTDKQLIDGLDKGLKAYENLLGVEVLESKPEYMKLCEVLTAFQFKEVNRGTLKKAYNKFIKSL